MSRATDIIDSIIVDLSNIWRGTSGTPGVGSALGLVKSYDDLPDPPSPEPSADNSMASLSPDAQGAIQSLEVQFAGNLAPIGWEARRSETRRTLERQQWLYGIGRSYKAPGRTGIVTNASTPSGPHVEGRAADYVYRPISGYENADRDALMGALATIAASRPDLTWGGNFIAFKDTPHWEYNA